MGGRLAIPRNPCNRIRQACSRIEFARVQISPLPFYCFLEAAPAPGIKPPVCGELSEEYKIREAPLPDGCFLGGDARLRCEGYTRVAGCVWKSNAAGKGKLSLAFVVSLICWYSRTSMSSYLTARFPRLFMSQSFRDTLVSPMLPKQRRSARYIRSWKGRFRCGARNNTCSFLRIRCRSLRVHFVLCGESEVRMQREVHRSWMLRMVSWKRCANGIRAINRCTYRKQDTIKSVVRTVFMFACVDLLVVILKL